MTPPTVEPPRCPHCGEQTMIEVAGREGFCNVCSKSFTLRKIDAPVKDGH